MATDATADDQIARFAADLTLLHDPHADPAPLLLAVSGGPDSMAMLTLAAAAFPGRIAAATVDHGLRARRPAIVERLGIGEAERADHGARRIGLEFEVELGEDIGCGHEVDPARVGPAPRRAVRIGRARIGCVRIGREGVRSVRCRHDRPFERR